MDFLSFCDQYVKQIETLLPEFLKNHEDFQINQGNVALCIISADNQVYTRMFGADKLRLRETAQIAWRKASQVWITGYPTGEFEELVWGRKLDWWKYGIMKPDYIGWEGGLPVELDGEKLAVAFSGFRGEKDVEITKKALSALRARVKVF